MTSDSSPDASDRTVGRRSVLVAAAGMTVFAGLWRMPQPGEVSGAAALAGPGTDHDALTAGPSAWDELAWPAATTGTASAASTRTVVASATRTATTHAKAPRHATLLDPRSARPVHPGIERYVSGAERDLVLSIDDGPSSPYTREVLAILRHHDVKATFCMVGENVARYPDVARSVAAHGHQLANHTWSHAWLPHLSHRAMVREVDRAQEILDHVTGGAEATVFRAPFGAWSTSLLRLCWKRRMRAVGWSIDPRDWARPPAHQIVTDVVHNAKPGRIILDHDGGGDRSHTVEALRVYLPRLLHLGYRFVLP